MSERPGEHEIRSLPPPHRLQQPAMRFWSGAPHRHLYSTREEKKHATND
jgi:hypothetical protein